MTTFLHKMLLGLTGLAALCLCQATAYAGNQQPRNTSINQHLRQKLNTWHDSFLTLKKDNARLLKENSDLNHEAHQHVTNIQNLTSRNESLDRDNQYLRQKSNDLENRLEILEDMIKDSRLN